MKRYTGTSRNAARYLFGDKKLKNMGSDQPTARAEFGVIKTFLPYLWPRGEFELKARVIVALLFLVGAKVANVYIPVLYKYAVDALGGGEKAGAAVQSTGGDTTSLIVVPVALIIGYGLVRILVSAFGEMRDAVFAKVAQRAIRTGGIMPYKLN